MQLKHAVKNLPYLIEWKCSGYHSNEDIQDILNQFRFLHKHELWKLKYSITEELQFPFSKFVKFVKSFSPGFSKVRFLFFTRWAVSE